MMARGESPYQANAQKSIISFIQPESQGNHKPVWAGTKSIWTLKVHIPAAGRNSNSRARICEGIQKSIHAKEKAICWLEENTGKLWNFSFLQTHDRPVLSEVLVPSTHQTDFIEDLTLCRNKKHFQKSVLTG